MITLAGRRPILLLLLLAAGTATTRAAAQVAPGERDVWQTAGWATATPEEQGMDPTLPAAVDQRVPEELALLSGLVSRGGAIVAERYLGVSANR